VIDDYSRIAYAQIHHDESQQTAVQVIRNAVAWFAERGVTVETSGLLTVLAGGASAGARDALSAVGVNRARRGVRK
jgi:hypothetical protein